MEDRQRIFETLRRLLEQYSPPFTVVNNVANAFALGAKPVVVNGRKVENNLFASVIMHPRRVSLYFMPVYTIPALAGKIPRAVEALRSGKSSYNIRHLDERLLGLLSEVLDMGLDEYRKRDWV